jgi:hypothetical protein
MAGTDPRVDMTVRVSRSQAVFHGAAGNERAASVEGHSKIRRLVRANFVVAVWLSIAYLAYQFANNVHRAHQIHEQYGWSGKDFKIILGPLIVASMLLFSWFRFWRSAAPGGGFAASLFGVGFIFQIIVLLLLPQVGVATSAYLVAYHTYVAVSYLSYGMRARPYVAEPI